MGARFIVTSDPEYPPLLRMIDSAPPLLMIRGDARALRQTLRRDRRLAQRLGVGARLHRAPGARPRARGLCDRLGPRARRRHGGPSRLRRNWNGRGSRRRPCAALPFRKRALARKNRPVRRRRDLRNAAGMGAARPRFSAPQPPRLGPRPRHGRRRGGASVGLVDHGPLRRGAGARGFRRAGLAARSTRRGNQRPFARRRDALRLRRGCDARSPGAAHGAFARRGSLRRVRAIRRGGAAVRRTGSVLLSRSARAAAARGARRRPGSFRRRRVQQFAESEAPAASARDLVLSLLSPAPVAIDELIRAVGLPARDVQTALLDLDLEGRLERHGAALVSLLVEKPGA